MNSPFTALNSAAIRAEGRASRQRLAARKGLTCPVLVLVAGFTIPTQPPKDAA